jgi:hypothetical protein
MHMINIRSESFKQNAVRFSYLSIGYTPPISPPDHLHVSIGEVEVEEIQTGINSDTASNLRKLFTIEITFDPAWFSCTEFEKSKRTRSYDPDLVFSDASGPLVFEVVCGADDPSGNTSANASVTFEVVRIECRGSRSLVRAGEEAIKAVVPKDSDDTIMPYDSLSSIVGKISENLRAGVGQSKSNRLLNGASTLTSSKSSILLAKPASTTSAETTAEATFDQYSSLIILVAVLLRLLTSLHPHSGQGKPPMFGDFEAQRHWVEITTGLPLEEW